MKLSLVAALGLVAPAFAQFIEIIEPMQGDNITLGVPFLVSNPDVVNIGLGLTLLPCGDFPNGICPPQSEAGLGNVLYAGPYNPSSPLPRGGFYTNFTVHTPEDAEPGKAIIGAVFTGLAGTETEPVVQLTTTSVFLH